MEKLQVEIEDLQRRISELEEEKEQREEEELEKKEEKEIKTVALKSKEQEDKRTLNEHREFMAWMTFAVTLVCLIFLKPIMTMPYENKIMPNLIKLLQANDNYGGLFIPILTTIALPVSIGLIIGIGMEFNIIKKKKYK